MWWKYQMENALTIAAVNTAKRSPAGSEIRTGLELVIALIDLRAGEVPETIHAEFLAAEAAHHGAVDNGAAEICFIDIPILGFNPLAREVANETSRETVPSASRIEHIFQ